MSFLNGMDPVSRFSTLRGRTRQSRIPHVAKAGSLTSPPVLSPGSENDSDFFLNGNDDSTLNVLPDIVPTAHLTATIPLFSPSEGSLHPPISNTAEMYTNMAFADADPVDHSLPTPPLSDSERLRLPSFNLLGIAAPHPDDIDRGGSRPLLETMGIYPAPWMEGSNNDDPMDIDTKLMRSNFQTRPTLRHSIDLMTPPEDASDVMWKMPLTLASGPGPHSSSGPFFGVSPAATTGPVSSGSIPAPASVADSRVDTDGDASGDAGPAMWLLPAMSAIIQSVNVTNLTGSTLRVLSHALPSPSIPGHSFPWIIDQLRLSSPSSPIMWINLLHAVPGRFSLADLPTSPPATPGLPLGGGDDYFTTKVFESAVTAVDFEGGMTPMHSRHSPLAAPGSINLCMVERYIPPTSANEFANLFNLRAPSLLIDRMAELAPGNGCLMFVYPTKTGAETFLREYLGPVLDPLLRTLVVVNNYTADLSNAVGRMLSVERLPEFDMIRQRTEVLCNELNKDGTHARQRLHSTKGRFNMVYAAKREVEMDRAVWTDWWIKQEKPRIRLQVANYFANRTPRDGDITAAALIQELLEGVKSRPYSIKPTAKIEVGVYVISRGAQ